jgi:hypothetical protein
VTSEVSEDMKTKTKFVKITSTKGFERLGLRKTKTAIYRELTTHISKLGTEYSSIRLGLGPRGGLSGYIAEYPKGKGAYLRIAEYTIWKKSKTVPLIDEIVTQTASPQNHP